MLNPLRLDPGLATRPPASMRAPAATGPAFADLLRQQTARPEGLRFSAHAQQRIAQRNIALSTAELARIDDAVAQAATKGARETLLLLDRAALVVSIPNRTVITALSREEAAQTVFTQIDSAVVVPSGAAAESNNRSHGPDPLGGSPNAADRLTRRPSMEY